MKSTLAQLGGAIGPPLPGSAGVTGATFFETGLPAFLNNLIRLITIIGGLFFLFNILIAGFSYISASGDPKKVEEAWAKIWQSLIGLLIMVSFIIFAGLINELIFKKSLTGFDILQPIIKGPGTL